MDTKVYLLDGGSLELDHSQLFWGRSPGRRVRFPVYSVLVEHKDGRFLFDTGFNKEVFDALNPGNAQQTDAQTIPGALALIGLAPRDITHVLNSHYHLDHVGGNKFCTCATTVCHKLELEAAANPEPFEARGYADMSFAPHLRRTRTDLGAADDIYTPRFECVTGDQEIAKGVTLLRADWTRRDPAITQALEALGRSGVPVYVSYKAGRAPVVLSEILSVSEVRAVLATL